jgi:MFS family permease
MPGLQREAPGECLYRQHDDPAQIALHKKGLQDTPTMMEAIPQKSDPYASLRFPDFRRFITGHFLASIGSQMQTVAIGWYLYERTDSALALGMVGLAQVLPIILLTLPAGHLADRHDRKRLLMMTVAAQCLISLGLAAVSHANGAITLLYALLVANGMARAVLAPARDSLGPQLLPVELLSNGATWRSGLFQLSAVLGPAGAGLTIGISRSATPAFLITAAVLALFVLLLIPIQPRAYVASKRGVTWENLLAGVHFIRAQRILIATITLDLFAVLLGGATMLLPVFAKDILHVGPRGLGWLMAAPSIGAMIVTIPLARKPMQRAGRALLWAVTGFSIATIAFGLSRSFPLSLLLLALIGGFDMVSVVIRSTLVQVLTPDELRGRVGAINALFIGTSNELGGFESGAAAALLGPVRAVVYGGIGSILVVGAVAKVWPEVRRFGALVESRNDQP